MSNPVMYFEIGCRSLDKGIDFYKSLFDWHFHGNHLDTGEGGIGGHVNSLGHEPHNYTIFYVQVDDIPATLEKVAGLGGKPIVGPIEIESGWFAWFSDPDGNTVGLWKQK